MAANLHFCHTLALMPLQSSPPERYRNLYQSGGLLLFLHQNYFHWTNTSGGRIGSIYRCNWQQTVQRLCDKQRWKHYGNYRPHQQVHLETTTWYRKFLDHRTAYNWMRTSSEWCLYEPPPTSAAQKQNNTDYSFQNLNVLYIGTEMCQYRGLYCWQILYQTAMGRLCCKRMDKDRSKQLAAQAWPGFSLPD